LSGKVSVGVWGEERLNTTEIEYAEMNAEIMILEKTDKNRCRLALSFHGLRFQRILKCHVVS
jgi:hypothetical protein